MASTVLNGTGNFSYTNNTGQNVRVVVYGILVSWSDAKTSSVTGQVFAITAGNSTFSLAIQAGINNAYVVFGKGVAAGASNNEANPVYNISQTMLAYTSNLDFVAAMPTEYMLAPGQTIASSATPVANPPIISYNMLVIPENG